MILLSKKGFILAHTASDNVAGLVPYFAHRVVFVHTHAPSPLPSETNKIAKIMT